LGYSTAGQTGQPAHNRAQQLDRFCIANSESIAVTAGDIAYLRALYSLDMEQPLALQRADIQNKMMREFQKLSAE
jgi:hypothetical protein